MLKDDVEGHKSRCQVLEPAQNKIISILEIVEALDRLIAKIAQVSKNGRELWLIRGMDRYVEIARQFFWKAFPGTEDAVADVAIVQKPEKGLEKTGNARVHLNGGRYD